MTARNAGRFLPLVVACIAGFGWELGHDQARATPYWGDAEIESFLRGKLEGQIPEVREPHAPGDAERIDPDPVTVLSRICAFLDTWQVDIPGDPNNGGIREGEHLPDIIQTDNTSEAIWVWTRYYELTGDNRYHPNILSAFQYSLTHAAYNEEGGSTPNFGYYRMYNCGWAVTAERKYRRVYGDATYLPYGNACGDYIRDHTLDRFGNQFYDYVNPPVLAWAAGNLYDVGLPQGRMDWVNAAVASGNKVRQWVEADAAILPNETWAMSGGATMWGLLHSYFAANPGQTAAWLALYKDQMDLFSSPGDFENAWNGWYAYGHRAVGLAIADPFHLGQHVTLTQVLIDEDGDEDGGVPARPPDTDNMDQTWVSNYLATFGVSDIAGPTSGLLAGGASGGAIQVAAAPNPFGERTRVLIDLPQAATTRVTVHDVAGRSVATLANGWSQTGRRELLWDGARLPSGMYWIRVVTPEGGRCASVQIQR